MSVAELMTIAKDGLITYARVAGPLMVMIMIVGVVISFFQAITQIQEQSLTFVPKMILTGVGLYFFLSFMGASMMTYMAQVAAQIAHGR